MSCDCGHASANTENERKSLRIALGLNATTFSIYVAKEAAEIWRQTRESSDNTTALSGQ
ncbi:hypothetical protein SAMN05446934_9824 [Paraburkholderia hospita]|jgi:hypothetical protein|nr:hypothetical protein PMI06_009732 [Burkholderia sp. BT03]SKC56786.1 hypothetical protein SAMN06266956_0855 [Paraburkholderia hospita]SKD06052.1 hypothetical protein SAMN05446934_9824 [Paraburkholderia hospita]